MSFNRWATTPCTWVDEILQASETSVVDESVLVSNSVVTTMVQKVVCSTPRPGVDRRDHLAFIPQWAVLTCVTLHKWPFVYGKSALLDICTYSSLHFLFALLLTCTLSSADQWWSRWSSSPFSRSGEENADTVFGVWFQMPDFVGERADSVSLRPWRMAGSVHDLATNHRPIAHYGVCVQLNDQVGGAWPQQLGRSYRAGWDYIQKKTELKWRVNRKSNEWQVLWVFFYLFCFNPLISHAVFDVQRLFLLTG